MAEVKGNDDGNTMKGNRSKSQSDEQRQGQSRGPAEGTYGMSCIAMTNTAEEQTTHLRGIFVEEK